MKVAQNEPGDSSSNIIDYDFLNGVIHLRDGQLKVLDVWPGRIGTELEFTSAVFTNPQQENIKPFFCIPEPLKDIT